MVDILGRILILQRHRILVKDNLVLAAYLPSHPSFLMIAFYYLFKTIIVLWLALPQFRGAQYVYHAFIRPLFVRHITLLQQNAPGTVRFEKSD